jgi:two-component system LytT family response regulator
MKVRALIVDDEPLAREWVRAALREDPEVEVLGECGDGLQAVEKIEQLRPDAVFLDVQMPGLDGMGVIRTQGADRMPVTVFVTAHDEYAVRAFEAQALDYLVKPLSEARFRATITRVRERIRASRAGKRLAVPTDTGELLLDATEIDWIGAQDDHVEIHAGTRRFRVRQALGTLEGQLDASRFLRIHRSAIVRLDHVRELRSHPASRTASLILRDGTTLPVSRRRIARVRGLLTNPPA